MAIKHLAVPLSLTLKSKQQIAPNVYHFVFTPAKPFKYKAGQHALFELRLKNGKKARRPFSISAAPSEGIISFTTRVHPEQPSLFKQALLKLKIGSVIKMRGAVGPLYITPKRQRYAFLASGIGITPFRSILTELATQKADNHITLFYVGNKDHHFFREDIASAKAALPNLNVVYIYKPDRITGHIIEEALGKELKTTTFFLAGSYDMIKSYRRTLYGLGVSWSHIKSDPFVRFKRPGLRALINKL